jgi:hypothetical protein
VTRIWLLLAIAACSHRDDLPDRVSGWREDLRTLATELPQRHANAFFHVAEAPWRRDVDALDQRIPQLDDAHMIAGLTRLVAALGDGHTDLEALGTHGVYPLQLVWFEDGIFVVGAEPANRWAIGRRLAGIGAQSIDQAIAAMSPLVSRDNDAGLRGLLPTLLLDPVLLAGTDLGSADGATFRLADQDGSIRELALRPVPRPVSVEPPRSLPLHLQGPLTRYWNKYVEADHLVYFAYNACAEDPSVGPFAQFAASTLAFADQHRVDRFVIDLRRNGGGNSRILQPLIDGLAARPALAGRVFVITGMHTFSSAVLNAMDLVRHAHATLVGGPTAGKPSGYGEVKTFALPHSKLVVQYSTKLFSNPDFPGDALEPKIPVKVTSDDWFSGRDPQMDAILRATVPRP